MKEPAEAQPRREDRRSSRSCTTKPRQMGLVMAITGLLILLPALQAAAQNGVWAVQTDAERADVSFGKTDLVWWTGRLQLSYRAEGKGGVFFTVEHQDRETMNDTTIIASGYRHLDEDWTLSGQAAVTPNADFNYKHMGQVEVHRRLVGTLVGHVGYQYLRFTTATVHLFMPTLTYYHARGEVQARGFLGRNEDTGHEPRAVLFRAQHDVTEKLRLHGGVSVGEGIFDITSLAGKAPEGWVVFFNPEFRLTPKDSIGAVLLRAHEDPDFEKRSLGLYYRRVF